MCKKFVARKLFISARKLAIIVKVNIDARIDSKNVKLLLNNY